MLRSGAKNPVQAQCSFIAGDVCEVWRGSEFNVMNGAPTWPYIIPKGPCAQIVYTLAPKYLYGDYFIRPKHILFKRMDP